MPVTVLGGSVSSVIRKQMGKAEPECQEAENGKMFAQKSPTSKPRNEERTIAIQITHTEHIIY